MNPHVRSILWWLDALARGAAPRAAAAAWARDVVVRYDPDLAHPLEDPYAWEVLERLGAGDLQPEAGRYVHGPDDFREWARILEERSG